MSRQFLHRRAAAATAFASVLVASSLIGPSAYAADEPSSRYVSAVRIDATDQLVLSITKGPAVTARFDYVDPVYGTQSVTLTTTTDGQRADNGSAPMCAVVGDRNPNPSVTVTFNPGTADATSETLWYYSVSNGTYNTDYLTDLVAEKTAKVAKANQRVTKAKAGVRKAKRVLAQARESHRASWVKAAERRLVEAKARLASRRALLATHKRDLASAEASLQDLEDDIAYCASRRPA